MLERNKTEKLKRAGPSLRAVELLMKAEANLTVWHELVRMSESESPDRDAVAALCYEAWTLIKRGMPLPPPVSDYVENILVKKIEETNRRQGGSGRHAFRDAFISQAIVQLKKQLDLSFTLSFSIIAQVLQSHGYKITAKGVERVWEKQPNYTHF